MPAVAETRLVRPLPLMLMLCASSDDTLKSALFDSAQTELLYLCATSGRRSRRILSGAARSSYLITVHSLPRGINIDFFRRML